MGGGPRLSRKACAKRKLVTRLAERESNALARENYGKPLGLSAPTSVALRFVQKGNILGGRGLLVLSLSKGPSRKEVLQCLP